MPHRTLQSYQLSQFIQLLTKPTDSVIVCGDMNCEPSDLGYRIIRDVTGLVDAWDKHGKVKVLSIMGFVKKIVIHNILGFTLSIVSVFANQLAALGT